ncbi:hypothetical protein ACF09I_28605 [Streptomyces sp. NPDC014940]|uniref:hypothetical protein n=1 Tax=Streptomyces sp. NPDC014940 TaxID=3364932 RepID=UPI0036FC426E
MTRLWTVPVHDSTRVRDARVAAEEAGARARLDAHRTAVAAPVATEPATNPLKHAGGGTVLVSLRSDGLPGRWVPPDDPAFLGHDPAVVAATVLRDAGSAAGPVRDDTCVAVLACDRPAGHP